MPRPATPPDDASLRNYLLGTLNPDESERIARWAEQDASASSRLAGIDARDPVTDTIRESLYATEGTSMLLQPTKIAENERSTAPDRPMPAAIGGYRVIRELGRGGMGVVYEAEDARLGRRVAIKLVARGHSSDDPAAAERFLREARAVARIEHDNVVPILHVDEDDGRLYIVMPLLKGETLDSRLKRESPLPVDELLRIARGAASGLAAAHAAGLVHRDVKPANIWLEAGTGRVRLLDFGLVKAATAEDGEFRTEAGSVMGTPSYMAPEQADGKPVDARTDLFSLGAVLYHAATGRRAFQGETKLAILLSVISDSPPRAEQLNANLPPDLTGLIHACLQKQPEARPASAAEALRLLQPEIESPPPGRRPRWAVAAAALAAIAALAAVVVIIRDKNGKEVARREIPDGGSATIGTGSAPPPAETTEVDVDREIATWLLGRKDILVEALDVQLTGASGTRSLVGQGKVPSEKFVITNLWLSGDGLSDADIKRVSRLKSITYLNINHSSIVTDESLQSVSEMRLEHFDATSVRITGAGLSHLKNMPTLKGMRLYETRITDLDLEILSSFPSLQKIGIDSDLLSQRGLAFLAKIPGLVDVALAHGRKGVVDAQLAYLAAACPKLTSVAFANDVEISDAGLRAIATLPLDSLFLDRAPDVTDAGLAALQTCKTLNRATLQKTQVTPEGVKKFNAVLPNCTITLR
ncbi:MAG: protein kinase [Gemmataceae bacterium]